MEQATATLQKSYSESGYVVEKGIFSGKSLAMLGETLRSVLNKSAHGDSDCPKGLDDVIMTREAENHDIVYKAAQAMGSAASTYQLLGSSQIFNRVCEVAGFRLEDLHVMPMYLIIQPPSDERFDYCWHQDGAYYDWCRDLVTLWFPVNRGTKSDTGTISMIPGSHQDGIRETDTVLRHGFFKQMQSRLKEGELDQEEALEIELGDCCIMHGHTVHRSVANRSNSPRVAGVMRIANLGNQNSYERERFYCVHSS